VGGHYDAAEAGGLEGVEAGGFAQAAVEFDHFCDGAFGPLVVGFCQARLDFGAELGEVFLFGPGELDDGLGEGVVGCVD